MRKHFTTILLVAFTLSAMSQTPAGVQLLPNDIHSFVPFGAGASALVEEVPITGQSFTKALRINTFNKTGNGDYGLNANIKEPLHNGDVLWISFKARNLESKRESGESYFELRFDQLVNGKYAWPSHLESSISVGSNWTEISIPFIMKKDAKPEEVRLNIKFDTYAQRFEISPITFINCGQNVSMKSLPKSLVRYGGDAPDAPWRKEAAARIEKYRKGDLVVKVMDAAGKPVQGANVSIKMTKSAYGWGTAINSNNILDTTNPKLKNYRDTLIRYFNKIVFENEMKSKNWAKTDHNKTLKALDWLKMHNIDARGHVMVWPSWQHSPNLLPFKEDKAALKAEIFKLIDEETTVMKNRFTEWDVVNETYKHFSIIDTLGGKKIMLDWFAAARKNAPGVKLFLNEYTMFHTEGDGSESFYKTAKFLKDNGAAIDAIGEQSHIGGTPPSIDYVLERLNHFATIGLPIQISEFDITSDDDDFKARYLRDFFTAIFSHPATIGIVQWGFWESSHWIPAAALWDKDWNIRPEGRAFTELVSKTWATNVSGTTTKNGEYKTRGFNGEYEIMVTIKGKITKQKAILDSKGQNITIKL